MLKHTFLELFDTENLLKQSKKVFVSNNQENKSIYYKFSDIKVHLMWWFLSPFSLIFLQNKEAKNCISTWNNCITIKYFNSFKANISKKLVSYSFSAMSVTGKLIRKELAHRDKIFLLLNLAGIDILIFNELWNYWEEIQKIVCKERICIGNKLNIYKFRTISIFLLVNSPMQYHFPLHWP